MTRRWPLTGLLLAVLWIFVRGVELDPRALVGELLIGLVVGMLIAYFLRGFYTPTLGPVRAFKVAPYAGLYLLVFLKELVTANWDVAKRVLAPSMPIDPGVIEVPLRVRTAAAITVIANSITLTPGTLTMDYNAQTNTLYVHSLDGSDPDALLEPIRTWEDYALVIFDEELKPGDPVPQLETDGGDDGVDAVGGDDGGD